MYSPINIPSTKLAFSGALIGGLAGMALPLYVGWEIGEYVKNALEFGKVIGTATEVMGAVVLTAFAGSVTIPLGMIGGGLTGAAIGAVTGKVKSSLEKLVSKK